MGKKINEKFCNVSLQKVSDHEYWLHFEFLEAQFIVSEPVEIHRDLIIDDGTPLIYICEFLIIMKHIHWTIPRTELELLMDNPVKAIVDEYNKANK